MLTNPIEADPFEPRAATSATRCDAGLQHGQRLAADLLREGRVRAAGHRNAHAGVLPSIEERWQVRGVGVKGWARYEGG